MTQEQEIQDIIKKNLPAHVGDALKLRLEEAEKAEKRLKEQLALNDSQAKTIKHLEETLDKHRHLATRETEVKAREEAVIKKEIEQQITQLTFELGIEKEKAEFTKSVALGLVRNTLYRKNIFDTESQPGYNVPDGRGGYQWVQPTSITKNLTETETEE